MQPEGHLSGEKAPISGRKKERSFSSKITIRTRSRKVPMNMICQMVVIGSPMVSCSVWREPAERKVSVVILPGRGKGEPAYIGAGLSGRIDLRLAQYDTMKDAHRQK